VTAFAMDTAPRTPRRKRGFRSLATHVWAYTLAAMLVPVLAAFALRGIAYAMHCEPAAASCFAPPFATMMGAALKGLLEFAWFTGATLPITMCLTVIAGVAAIAAGRPLAASGSVLMAPLAALLLPVALVGMTTYEGCAIDRNGIGECVLWGQSMGVAFHKAAIAPELLYSYTPLCVSGAVMAGLLAWIVHWGCRQMDRT
jgi:hypothetical protein